MNEPRTGARLLILALVTVGTLVNYLDRTVISVAALPMRTELGFDAAMMGFVFSALSLVVGFIVAATGSFEWALAFIAILALYGMASYVFLVGDVRRVQFIAVAA